MLYKINSKIIISTSRKPSQITRRFAQFLKHYFNATYINRGKTSFTKILNQAKQHENSVLLIITETKGNPSNIDVYDLEDEDNPLISIHLSVSLPQHNNPINTNGDEITFINKVKDYNELFDVFAPVESNEKIKSNCILIEDKKEICARFFDKKGNDTKYKAYLKGYNIY